MVYSFNRNYAALKMSEQQQKISEQTKVLCNMNEPYQHKVKQKQGTKEYVQNDSC